MKEKIGKKKAGVRLWFVAALIVGVMFAYATFPHPVLEKKIDPETGVKTLHLVWGSNLAEAVENTPDDGESGFMAIFFHPHDDSPSQTYLNNDSSLLEANCTNGTYGFANADNFNLQISNSVTWDIVVRVRWNVTHAREGAYWNYNDTQVSLNASGGGCSIAGAYVKGTQINTKYETNGDYLWQNYYWNNNGTGFQLDSSGTCTFDDIKLEARF